jgi:hypothetical protein
MAMDNRLLRPRASGFDPRRIAGLELWLDAADSSTLFDAETGGSPITADGAVGRWVDKSGNGRNHTGVVNSRPIWRQTGRNGRGTLEFNGSAHRLTGDGTQYAKTNAPFTAIFVHVVDATAGSFPVLMSTKTNQTQNFRWINSNFTAGGGYTDYSQGANQNFVVTRYISASRGVWRYVLFDFAGSAATTGGSYSARAAKASLTQASAGLFGAESASGSAIGSESGGSGLFKGEIAEIIIYSKVLSVPERDAVEKYVTNKWAL